MKKIAIVEDNADNRLLLRAILGESYQLTEYELGLDALAGFKKDKPDLVLLDIALPVIDGMTVFHQIRADPALRDLPVIALTAHAMAGDRERFLNAGFNDYVTKPILDETVLLDIIKRWVNQSASS